jgi:hypothetical protein
VGHRRRNRGIVLPFALISIGGIFLLQNLGFVDAAVWRRILHLWPILLILVGIDMIARDRFTGLARSLFVALVVVAALAIVGFAAWAGAVSPLAGPIESRSFAPPLDGAKQLNVTVNVGGGDLNVGALADGDDVAARIDLTSLRDAFPPPTYRVRGDVGELIISNMTDRRGPEHAGPALGSLGGAHGSVQLRRDRPTDLRLRAGATHAALDLRGVALTRLTADVGASSLLVQLPEPAGQLDMRIRGGASGIAVEIPPNVPASIRINGGLSSIAIDENRFVRSDRARDTGHWSADAFVAGRRTYVSSDYERAPRRIDLQIDMGASSVEIR